MASFAAQEVTAVDGSAKSCDTRYKKNVVLSFGLIAVAYAIMINPDFLDRPFIKFINSYVGHNQLFDLLVYDLDHWPLLSGVIFIALIWGRWFESSDIILRSKIFIGTLISFVGGGVSRFLQHKLSTHPRPYYDPAVTFNPLGGFHRPDLNTWNSFPSDHATVYAGLVTVIWLSGSRFRVAAVIWLIIVEVARSYIGGHYPSDLVAGAGLGAAIVWLSQAPIIIRWIQHIVRFCKTSPSIFYSLAFIITYQIATLFSDVRGMAGGLVLLKHIF